MSGDASQAWTAAVPVSWLSPWMVRRETRIRYESPIWLTAVALFTAIGLLSFAWLWLAVATMAARAVFVGAIWLRVWAARRRARGRVDARVIATVLRGTVRSHGSAEAGRWDGDLIDGSLEATCGDWGWRPGPLSAGHFHRLDLPVTSIRAATWSPTHRPLLPVASYLQVRTHTGRCYDFLVWDHLRLPPLAPHREETPPGDACPE